MPEALKNHYNKSYMAHVARAMYQIYPSFDKEHFITLVFDDEWDERELKDRMHHVSTSLNVMLPANYEQAISILQSAAPLMEGVSEMGGLLNMFFPDYVEMYGQDNWDASIAALEEFTKYSSSEFAVRPFIKMDGARMMTQMLEWSKHENHHVRRLASEGCRPRLPWAMALPVFKKDPSKILPILRVLKNDEEEYVRRSVANNLNDIAKDNPDVVVGIAQQWHGENEVTDRLVKHACRTLLKSANKDALAIFGFMDTNSVEVKTLRMDKNAIKIGDDIIFSYELDIKTAGKLRFEYGIDYMKANGKTRRKIFQIKEGKYQAGALVFNKKHSFKQLSTRKHYVGKHHIALIINGVELATDSFLLE